MIDSSSPTPWFCSSKHAEQFARAGHDESETKDGGRRPRDVVVQAQAGGLPIATGKNLWMAFAWLDVRVNQLPEPGGSP